MIKMFLYMMVLKTDVVRLNEFARSWCDSAGVVFPGFDNFGEHILGFVGFHRGELRAVQNFVGYVRVC